MCSFGDRVDFSTILYWEICNRFLNRRSVILYSKEKFSLLDENSSDFVETYDGHFYICKTYSRKIKKATLAAKLFMINWRLGD